MRLRCATSQAELQAAARPETFARGLNDQTAQQCGVSTGGGSFGKLSAAAKVAKFADRSATQLDVRTKQHQSASISISREYSDPHSRGAWTISARPTGTCIFDRREGAALLVLHSSGRGTLLAKFAADGTKRLMFGSTMQPRPKPAEVAVPVLQCHCY